VSRTKKILIIVGLVGVSIGGFALTKWLTRNVNRVTGGVITTQTFDEQPQPIVFEN
jgi:homoserine acetyltransferase